MAMRVISPGRGLDPYRTYVPKGNPGLLRPGSAILRDVPERESSNSQRHEG